MDKNSIIDSLLNKDIELEDSTTLLIPVKCEDCKNQSICSVLQTLIEFYKIGVLSSIEECVFYGPKK